MGHLRCALSVFVLALSGCAETPLQPDETLSGTAAPYLRLADRLLVDPAGAESVALAVGPHGTAYVLWQRRGAQEVLYGTATKKGFEPGPPFSRSLLPGDLSAGGTSAGGWTAATVDLALEPSGQIRAIVGTWQYILRGGEWVRDTTAPSCNQFIRGGADVECWGDLPRELPKDWRVDWYLLAPLPIPLPFPLTARKFAVYQLSGERWKFRGLIGGRSNLSVNANSVQAAADRDGNINLVYWRYRSGLLEPNGVTYVYQKMFAKARLAEPDVGARDSAPGSDEEREFFLGEIPSAKLSVDPISGNGISLVSTSRRTVLQREIPMGQGWRIAFGQDRYVGWPDVSWPVLGTLGSDRYIAVLLRVKGGFFGPTAFPASYAVFRCGRWSREITLPDQESAVVSGLDNDEAVIGSFGRRGPLELQWLTPISEGARGCENQRD